MDKKPHPSRSREEISSLMQEWEISGLSKKLFAESKNINYMTFIGWFSRGTSKKSIERKFIPIHIPSANSGPFAELFLNNSRRIILYQPVAIEYLQSLMKC